MYVRDDANTQRTNERPTTYFANRLPVSAPSAVGARAAMYSVADVSADSVSGVKGNSTASVACESLLLLSIKYSAARAFTASTNAADRRPAAAVATASSTTLASTAPRLRLPCERVVPAGEWCSATHTPISTNHPLTATDDANNHNSHKAKPDTHDGTN